MSGKTGKGGKRIFIADDPLVPQALELAAKVFRKGSNPRINLSYLIKQESGHHSVVQEWHEILSFLRGKGASGLRKAPPMILESGYDAPKFEAPTVSAASERPLRHAVYVSFEEYAGRVERKRESDKFKVSRFNAPYYLGTWDDLNLPQREFMNEFLPRPIKSGEGAAAKEKNLDALIIEGLTALPKSRRAEFQRLIDDGSIETVREMLDYFSALVQGKPGAFRYKLHRGGFLGTLE
ncbi:hypothetical protein HYU13_06015, partial [Candidatus Woesearchaeota archaeon]|nr:hypothetical protein [Candidatus Woesearchaeota archaeon]